MSRPAGYIIDVPVMLSVAVRGAGSFEKAAGMAREFAEGLSPSQYYCDGYSEKLQELTGGPGCITEATLELEDGTCSLIVALEAEAEEVPQHEHYGDARTYADGKRRCEFPGCEAAL